MPERLIRLTVRRTLGDMSDAAIQLSPEDVERLLAQNAEMRGLLGEYQWSGLTPAKSHGVCPACCGSSRSGHRPGCAIAAALEAPELA
jgi:hypothetical protein